MIKMPLNLQASVFLDTSEILPNPETLTELIKMFSDKNMIPGTFTEINVATGAPLARVKLTSMDKVWNINFATQRINIIKTPAQGIEIGSPGDFVAEATKMFQRIFKHYLLTATRLSFVEEGLWDEKSDGDLSSIFKKLFRPTEFYSENEPFEWNWRAVSQYPLTFHDMKEQLNAITVIERVSGEIQKDAAIKKFDRIKVTLDINTVLNEDKKFDVEAVEDFFAKILPLRDTLMEQITGVIDG